MNLIEPNERVASCGEKLLVGRDFEAIYLRICKPKCSGTNTGRGLPEPNLMVVTTRSKNHRHAEIQKVIKNTEKMARGKSAANAALVDVSLQAQPSWR
jgi:hypothetical protein